MKVLLVNGSPNEKGCTYTALDEIKRTLEGEGLEAEIFWIGTKPISGCLACGCCAENLCAINDVVNDFLEKAEETDGFIFGSPVHYASAAGAMLSFMDRVFFSGGRSFKLKPAAAIVSARRAGTGSAFDGLNKYFTISEMPIISSCYWNNVHGTCPQEVLQDAEGLRIMRTLARNMAWFLKIKNAGEAAGICPPEAEPPARTNFIR